MKSDKINEIELCIAERVPGDGYSASGYYRADTGKLLSVEELYQYFKKRMSEENKLNEQGEKLCQ